MPQTLHGKVRGRTIEVSQDLGLVDGQDVEISVRPVGPAALGSEITIVDRGRGPQLSTSRITVQDIYPYLQQRFRFEQIHTIMPVLTPAEFQVVVEYVESHCDEVAEQDRLIREHNANRIIPPDILAIQRRGAEKMEAIRSKRKPEQPIEGRK